MDIKLGHWHNKSHEGRAVLRIYANQPTHPLWQVWLLSNFNLHECLFPALAISRCAEAWTPSIIVTARPQFYESQSYTKIALFMLFNASSRGQLCRGAGGAQCWPGSWLKHLSDIFCRVQQFKYTEEHWGLHYLGLGSQHCSNGLVTVLEWGIIEELTQKIGVLAGKLYRHS